MNIQRLWAESWYAHWSRACGEWVWLIVLINACCYSCTTADCASADPRPYKCRPTPHSFINEWIIHSFSGV